MTPPRRLAHLNRGSFLRSVANMSKEDIARPIRDALASIAPEADNKPLDPDAISATRWDLDSRDLLNFVIALHEASGVGISRRKTIRHSQA